MSGGVCVSEWGDPRDEEEVNVPGRGFATLLRLRRVQW